MSKHKALATTLLLLALPLSCGEVKKSHNAEALGPVGPSKAELAEIKSAALDEEMLKIFDCAKAVDQLSTDEQTSSKPDHIAESGRIAFDSDHESRTHSLNQPKYPKLKYVCANLKGDGQSLTANFRKQIDYFEVIVSGQKNTVTLDMNADDFAGAIRVKIEGPFNNVLLKGKSTAYCDKVAYSNTGLESTFTCAGVEK